jgi:integrase/recombinase XerD
MRLFMYQENVQESLSKVGVSENTPISSLIEPFLVYAEFELCLAKQSIIKYRECLNWVVRGIGDLEVGQITMQSVTQLKQGILMRGAGESRVSSIVFTLKSFLRYCSEFMDLKVLDYKKVKSMKRRRKEVLFLSNEEVEKFAHTPEIYKRWSGKKLKTGIRLEALRFRCLVEVLLGTGMRISEALSLDRETINFERGEAKIVGKGSRERTVFFSGRAMHWIGFYLENRQDTYLPLFVTQSGQRLTRADADSLFRRYSRKSGLKKKVTPHILRHTVATNLLFNGCPISHVKEILGHDRLETTCKYYLGVDKAKAKEAHGSFLRY